MACRLVGADYLNQCWNIVNWNLRKKLQWDLKRNSYIFIEEKAFENVVCEMAGILYRPLCVNQLIWWRGLCFLCWGVFGHVWVIVHWIYKRVWVAKYISSFVYEMTNILSAVPNWIDNFLLKTHNNAIQCWVMFTFSYFVLNFPEVYPSGSNRLTMHQNWFT